MKTSNHAAHSLTDHIVLTTKYRRRCIDSQMLARLRELFARTCEAWRCELVEFSGEADHVHLLVAAQPSMNLSHFVANLKTVSSRKIRQEFAGRLARYYWKNVFWNSAYAVVSAGGHASIEQLVAYIQNQETPR